MKVSVYTYARNALRQDYHLPAMLRHHLPFADEIVVHEGLSTDGTFEAIKDLDPKVKVFRSDWSAHTGIDYIYSFKAEARKRCTGDWCVMLDADEFIPEWEFDTLRETMRTTDKNTLLVTMRNFYGNYKVYHPDPAAVRWPVLKRNIHRNRPDVALYGGDASSVTVPGEAFTWDPAEAVTDCHHFGYVRHAARLRQTWRDMRGLIYNAPPPRFKLPGFLYTLFPHDWADPMFLPALRVYDGPYIQAVRDDPTEFTRDKMKLYKLLSARRQ